MTLLEALLWVILCFSATGIGGPLEYAQALIRVYLVYFMDISVTSCDCRHIYVFEIHDNFIGAQMMTNTITIGEEELS